MTEDILIQQLREINYPGKIDITDQVMAEVSKRPYLIPVRKTNKVQKISAIVAACIAMVLIVNFSLPYTRNYDALKIGNALSEVYVYHANYGVNENNLCDLGGFENYYE